MEDASGKMNSCMVVNVYDEKIRVWLEQNITVWSPHHYLPHKTLKIFSDHSHLMWNLLTSGSQKSLLSNRRPRNMTYGTVGRVLLFRIRVGRFLAVKNENPFSRAQCDR
jgi:hypothetical protein